MKNAVCSSRLIKSSRFKSPGFFLRLLCAVLAGQLAVPPVTLAQLLLRLPELPAPDTVRLTLEGAAATNRHVIYWSPALPPGAAGWQGVQTGAVGQVTFELPRPTNAASFYRAQALTATEPVAPQVYAGPDQILVATNGTVLQGAGTGNDALGLPPGYTWTVVSQPAGAAVNFAHPGALDSAATFSQPGAYVLQLTGDNGVTNSQSTVRVWVVPVPPDPAGIAPPLDRTEPSCVAKGTEFLYAGANPVQYGVAPGTMVFERTAILRGRVLDTRGNGLAGVGVGVLNHPEFGATATRADGRYDLAVNGGAPLTLHFDKAGCLAVQRRVEVPWQRYVTVPDVALTGINPSASRIALNSAAWQAAAGAVETDANGARQAYVLFPPDLTAQMELPNGLTLPLNSLTVRLTEYTVGPDGWKAMPGELPPSVGYTYCVEAGVDEAVAAGAETVRFNQPVSYYLENFLRFPVGTVVPVGFYERSQGCWVPSANGLVVKLLSVAGGQAALDVDNSGTPATADQLQKLKVTAGELAALAARYPAGQELWRVQTTHFTPVDLNWPTEDVYSYSLQNVGQAFPTNSPQVATAPVTEQPSYLPNPAIDLQNQVRYEAVPVTGTPFTLNYSSDRVPGHSPQMAIPLRSDFDSPYVSQIIVQVSCAGHDWQQTFDYAAVTNGQTATYTAPNVDAYGRLLQGQQVATVKIGMVTPMYYVNSPTDASDLDALSAFFYFMRMGLDVVPFPTGASSRTAPPLTTWRSYDMPVSFEDLSPEGVGGWTLNAHHTYNPATQTLKLGDGTQRSALSVNAAVRRLGGGTATSYGSGDSAAVFAAVAPDGSLVFSDFRQLGHDQRAQTCLIYRQAPDGTITILGGNGAQPPAEGLPATNAYFGASIGAVAGLAGLAAAPDGGVYFAGNYRIWKIQPDGTLHSVAGTGSPGYSGDNGPATNAALNFSFVVAGANAIEKTGGAADKSDKPAESPAASDPTDGNFLDPVDMAVYPDGTLLFIDYNNHALRQIGNDGNIYTVAGGNATNTAEGIFATQAALVRPSGLAVSPEGDIYVGDATGIRVIHPGGTIAHVPGFNHPVAALAYAPNHCLYALADGFTGANNLNGQGGQNIYEITPYGAVTQVAGMSWGNPFNPNALGYDPDGVGALNFPLSALSLAVDANNNLYFAQGGVWRVSRPLPNLSRTNILIASDDGSELYNFSGTGKHLSTVDAVTGQTLLGFGYDANGLLIAVTNVYGDITAIEWDGRGQATAIISPDGQRTALGYDANGWLNHIASPAGETYAMTYAINGLIQTFTNPRGMKNQITFDEQGRFKSEVNAVGGATTTLRQDLTNGVQVAALKAMHYNPALYTVRQLSGNNTVPGSTNIAVEYHENVAPDGSTNRVWTGQNGVTASVDADGTRTVSTNAPDPRWGMQAPYASYSAVTLPSGLAMTNTTRKSVTLADVNNSMSLLAITNVTQVNGVTWFSLYQYDGAHRTLLATSPLNRKTVSVLDDYGRVTQTIVSNLAPALNQYDARGRLVQTTQTAEGATRTTRFDYDQTQNGGVSSGRLTNVTDTLGRTLAYTYDPAGSGRVVRQTYPNGRYLSFQYDANGNLTGVTPPQKPQHQFAFDAVDAVTNYTPPVVPDFGMTTYAYNLQKQLTNVTRPDGTQSQYEYDPAIGWLTRVALPNGADIRYTYVQNGCGCSGVGRPETVTFTEPLSEGRVPRVPNTNTLHYTYDGSLVTAVDWSGSVTGRVTMAYDNFFRVRQLTVNGTDAVSYTYDLDGLLATAGGLTLQRNLQNGMLTGSFMGSLRDNWTYNGFGEANGYTATYNGAGLYGVTLRRDNAGRITNQVETVNGTAHTTEYRYDAARGWLTDVLVDGAATGHYEYDDNGNRTRSVTLAGDAEYDPADDQDRLLSATLNGQPWTWTYTTNGEVASQTLNGQTTSYAYDGRGNLRGATLPDGTAVDYLVDASGRRIGRMTNGVMAQRWLYQDDLKPLVEMDGQGRVVSRFVYATHANVPDYLVKGGQTNRVITDVRGSVRLVVNVTTGVIAQQMDYDEYGQVTQDTNPGFQPFGYAGGLYDPVTKLTHFGARDYDPTSGRWLSKDPAGFGGGNNWYAYCDNDPVNHIDPNGYFGLISVGIVVGAVLLAVAAGLTAYYRWEASYQLGQAQMPSDTSNPGQLDQFNGNRARSYPKSKI